MLEYQKSLTTLGGPRCGHIVRMERGLSFFWLCRQLWMSRGPAGEAGIELPRHSEQFRHAVGPEISATFLRRGITPERLGEEAEGAHQDVNHNGRSGWGCLREGARSSRIELGRASCSSSFESSRRGYV